MADDDKDLKPDEVTYFNANLEPCSKDLARFADVHFTEDDGNEVNYWLELDDMTPAQRKALPEPGTRRKPR